MSFVPNQIKKVTVYGAGTMGAGIAQWFVQQGLVVELIDRELSIAEQAAARIHSSWEKLQAKGKFSAKALAAFQQKLIPRAQAQMDPNTDLVIEAIYENLQAKRDLFAFLDQNCNSKTILASNTSSFLLSSLAGHLPSARRERFLGLHFFNPAPIMQLVEVIASSWSSAELGRFLGDWLAKLGKKIAYCHEAPGFIVNRVARNYYGESLRLAGQGQAAECRQIDQVMTQVGGFPMGPFELMDLIGIDVNYSVTQSVWEAFYREPRFAPHALQRKMVESGRLGKKTKEGFYRYE